MVLCSHCVGKRALQLLFKKPSYFFSIRDHLFSVLIAVLFPLAGNNQDFILHSATPPMSVLHGAFNLLRRVRVLRWPVKKARLIFPCRSPSVQARLSTCCVRDTALCGAVSPTLLCSAQSCRTSPWLCISPDVLHVLGVRSRLLTLLCALDPVGSLGKPWGSHLRITFIKH